MSVPAADLHDPDDRTATGIPVASLYCPSCGHYSGDGKPCRVCRRDKAAQQQPKEA